MSHSFNIKCENCNSVFCDCHKGNYLNIKTNDGVIFELIYCSWDCLDTGKEEWLNYLINNCGYSLKDIEIEEGEN
jgi:hypothetical protein